MANPSRATFVAVAGLKRAGADLTDAIERARGARGTGVAWATVARWVAAGWVRRDAPKGTRDARVWLTDAGVEAAREGRAAQKLAASRKRVRGGSGRRTRAPSSPSKRAPARRAVSRLAEAST